MTPEQFEYMKLEMQAGRNLTRADNLGKKRVCVVADTMAKNYFGDKDPIGETVSVTMDDGSIFTNTMRHCLEKWIHLSEKRIVPLI